jgi:hypothetical protein
MLLLCALAAMPAGAKAPPVQVVVKDPYVDLHTGPGRGFPVTISVERCASGRTGSRSARTAASAAG